MTKVSQTTIYLKRNCPFCLKLRIFLVEAGIATKFDIVEFGDGDEVHKELRTRLEAAGIEPSFPAVQFPNGDMKTGTDDLIRLFGEEAAIDPSSLPLLQYYSDGVFKRHVEMFKELRELKAANLTAA